MTEIMRAHRWRTNAAMIAEAVVPLGYLDGTVLDATYGEGKFWTDWQPHPGLLFTNDLFKPAMTAHDYRDLPWPDEHILGPRSVAPSGPVVNGDSPGEPPSQTSDQREGR